MTHQAPKIHFSFGPACADAARLRQIIPVTGFCRINMSHQQPDALPHIFALLRGIAHKQNAALRIACDLRGRKLRSGPLAPGQTVHELRPRQKIKLRGLPVDAEQAFTDNTISVNYPNVQQILKKGHRVLLDDGAIELRVEAVHHRDIHCVLTYGEHLASRVGCNFPDSALDLPALSARDKRDLDLLAPLKPDALYLSYCEHADDIALLRRELQSRQMRAQIIAKIESQRALNNLDDIASQADMLCLARGDLGVALPWASLPQLQQKFAATAQKHNKAWILAGEVAISTLHRVQPSRAELSDLYLACAQGAAGIILSDESATGFAPDKSIPLLKRLLDDFCTSHSP